MLWLADTDAEWLALMLTEIDAEALWLELIDVEWLALTEVEAL